MDENIKQLRKKSHDLAPAIHVGKLGITESLIAELKLQLKKKRLIKVKILRGALDFKNKDELAEEIVKKTNALLVRKVGMVVTLAYKKDNNSDIIE